MRRGAPRVGVVASLLVPTRIDTKKAHSVNHEPVINRARAEAHAHDKLMTCIHINKKNEYNDIKQHKKGNTA